MASLNLEGAATSTATRWIQELRMRAAFLVCCRGIVRVTPSLGEPQTIGPGDCWLMEDTTGDGHETSVISEGPFEALIVQIP